MISNEPGKSSLMKDCKDLNYWIIQNLFSMQCRATQEVIRSNLIFLLIK